MHRRNAHRKQKITKTFLTMCLQFPISSLLFFLFLQLFNSNACCFCYLCWCCWWCSCYCGRYLLLMLLPLFKFSFGANIQNSLFVSWVFLCRIGSRIIIYVCISLVCSLALSAYLSAHKCNICAHLPQSLSQFVSMQFHLTVGNSARLLSYLISLFFRY